MCWTLLYYVRFKKIGLGQLLHTSWTHAKRQCQHLQPTTFVLVMCNEVWDEIVKLLLHSSYASKHYNRGMESPLQHTKHDVKFSCFLTSASDIFTSFSLRTELFSFTFRPSFLPSSFLRNYMSNVQNENIDTFY